MEKKRKQANQHLVANGNEATGKLNGQDWCFFVMDACEWLWRATTPGPDENATGYPITTIILTTVLITILLIISTSTELVV
jgi:hypothetical protein